MTPLARRWSEWPAPRNEHAMLSHRTRREPFARMSAPCGRPSPGKPMALYGGVPGCCPLPRSRRRGRRCTTHSTCSAGWMPLASGCAAGLRPECPDWRTGPVSPAGTGAAAGPALQAGRSWLAVSLLAAAPALFQPPHQPGIGRLAAALAGRTAAGGDAGHVPVAGQRPHAGREHDHETGDSDKHIGSDNPGQEQSDADDEPEGSLDDPALVVHSRVAGAHGVREPRVIGVKRLLDLLELALLVLRERHSASHQKLARGSAQRPSPHGTALPQEYEREWVLRKGTSPCRVTASGARCPQTVADRRNKVPAMASCLLPVSIDEGSGPDRVSPEPPRDPVHRPLRIPPWCGAFAQRQLRGGARGRDQAGGPHPDQPQPRLRT